MTQTQLAVLEFAIKYPTWHSYDTRCVATHKAVVALMLRGLLLVNTYNQFKAA